MRDLGKRGGIWVRGWIVIQMWDLGEKGNLSERRKS